jgi:hypothetical protein
LVAFGSIAVVFADWLLRFELAQQSVVAWSADSEPNNARKHGRSIMRSRIDLATTTKTFRGLVAELALAIVVA